MSNYYFFVMPSFSTGAARIFDIGANLDSGSYLVSSTPAEADARAAKTDLRAVLHDFKLASENGRESEAQKA